MTKSISLGLAWGIVLAGWLAGGLSMADTVSGESTSNIWQDSLIYPFGDIALTDRRIDQFIERLAKTNPTRAGELGALRIAQPEQFRIQIRDEMAKRFFQSVRQPAAATESKPVVAVAPSEAAPKPIQGENKGLIVWLEKNFPRQAEELKASPASSAERIAEIVSRYEPIMRAEQNNPPLAAAMKEDIAIQIQSDELLMDLQYATETEREAIIKELGHLTSQRFDLIVRKREIQYEQLRQRLEKLQQHLEKQKAELDQLKSTKEKSISDRVAEMVDRTQKTNWN